MTVWVGGGGSGHSKFTNVPLGRGRGGERDEFNLLSPAQQTPPPIHITYKCGGIGKGVLPLSITIPTQLQAMSGTNIYFCRHIIPNLFNFREQCKSFINRTLILYKNRDLRREEMKIN